MIRWSYLLPRLLLLAIVVGVIAYATNPLAKWAIVESMQSATEAKVDVDNVDVSYRNATVTVGKLGIADPGNKGKNLFQADQIVLQVDRNALLSKRFVVNQGTVSGLQFSTERTQSGQLDPNADDGVASRVSKVMQQWFEMASGSIQTDLSHYSETAKVCERLKEEWPGRYEELQTRIHSLHARIKELQEETAKLRRFNPLRHIDTYQEVIAEFQHLQAEVESVPNEIRALQNQINLDRQAVATATEIDKQRLHSLVKLDSLSADEITEYLLREQQAEQVQNVIAWIRWIRDHVPSKQKALEAARGRGETITFGNSQQPDFLIRTLAVNGTAAFSDQLIQFDGSMHGLTDRPDLYGQPMVVKLQTTGDSGFSVKASLDRTSDNIEDWIEVDVPRLAQPARILSGQEQVTVNMGEGVARTNIFVDLRGEQLRGRIVFHQKDLQLGLAVNNQPQLATFASKLDQSLKSVDELNLQVDIYGTLDQPTWKMTSDFGGKLREALAVELQAEIRKQNMRLQNQVDAYASAQLSEIQQYANAKSAELFASLQAGDTDVMRMAEDVTKGIDLPQGLRKAQLPIRELFK